MSPPPRRSSAAPPPAPLTRFLPSSHPTAKPTLEGGHLININGSGTYDGTKHYGVGREFTLTPLGHRGFHRDELSQEVVDGGHVRFQRWHM